MNSLSERPVLAAPVAFEAMLLESITDALLAVDGAWRFRYANRRAGVLLGRDPRSLVGSTLWDVFPDAADSALATALRRVMRERQPREGEAYTAVARTWVSFHVYPAGDGVAVLLRDAADRRRGEEGARLLADAGRLLSSSLDVQETLAQLAALVVPRLASVCVVDLVEDGGPRRAVTRAEDPALEQELSALRERAPLAAVPAHPVHRVLETAEPWVRLTMRLVEPIEGFAPVNWTSVAILPLVARGRTIGALSLGMVEPRRPFDEADVMLACEIAHRAAVAVDNAVLFAEAQAMRREAEAANQAKAEFLATMSHELRTPLTAIRGFTELVLEEVAGPLTEEQRDHLRRVNGASEHLLVLVEEVLGFARLQAGRAEVRVRACVLDEMADSACNLVRPLLDKKGLVLQRRTPPRRVSIVTDADKVRQILVNLLSNAVKFTDRGAVTLEADVDPDGVTLTVSDTGPGIAPEMLELIFEPFRQADQSLTRRAGGTGLGLAVARRLAQLLGGSLTVESTVGAGSSFRLRLPRRYRPFAE